ncbi:MAG: acetyl-CoA C-acyltransferase, partial [Burkholderiales bacterium]
MLNDPIVIVSVARTPMGGFQGELKSFAAPELGAAAIRAAVERARLKPEQVEEVIMGCVLPAGQGQAPARQAAIGAGLPLATGCTTVNKMCGSGMKAAMLAHDLLAAGTNDIMVAGGMESMTNAPYLLPKARTGYRMGHQQVIDHMFCDGLEDAYTRDDNGTGRLMGTFAEDCAAKYAFTREEQDRFAIASLERAQAANREGWFAWETTPMAIKAGKEERFVEADEQPFKANLEKIPTLKPAFRKDGTVTAANSSSISDGAAAMVLMRRSTAEQLGLKPLAVIVAHSTHAQEPAWFTTAPVGAIRKLYDRTGWRPRDVDLYEINEAFAVVTLAAMKEHGLPHAKVNVHGGACALGHPIGASGARI